MSVLALVILAVFFIKEDNVNATESHNWSSSKIPGSYTTSATKKTMTYYAGNVYFSAAVLTTDASYIAGKCEGSGISGCDYFKYT